MRKNFFAGLTTVLLLFVLLGAAEAENEATYNASTGSLNIPKVVVDSTYYEVDMQQIDGLNFSVITVTPTIDQQASIDNNDCSVLQQSIGGESINGQYEGFATRGPFATDSTTTTITIDNYNIDLILDSFFSGECRLTGMISADYNSASGSYQCSDFTAGNWSATAINTLLDGNLLYAKITLGEDDIIVSGVK